MTESMQYLSFYICLILFSIIISHSILQIT
jgi:hypothetical protein